MIIVQVLLFLLAAASIVAIGAAFIYKKRALAVPATVAAVVLLLAFAFTLSLVQVEAGYVGVVKQFGQIQPGTLSPGIHPLVPFMNSVETVDTRVHQIRIENFGAASKEQQNLFLTVTLNYHVDPNQAQNIVQNIGLDYEAKIVSPRMQSIPKAVTDNYPTTEVLGKREEIAAIASDELSKQLAVFGLVVEPNGFVLENFDYSPEYNAAIEQKQVAQQQVEVEKQKVQQAEQVRLQREKQAEADKNVAILQAQGQSESVREIAKGQADANRALAASISDPLIQYQMVQKLSDKIQILMLPSSSNFLLDPKSLLGGTAK